MTLLTFTLACFFLPTSHAADASDARATYSHDAHDTRAARATLVTEAQPTNADDAPRKRATLTGAIPAAVVSLATALVTLPMGAERLVEIDGKTYAFVLEPHYHAPGSTTTAPTGWHKGVTAYLVE